MVVMLEFLPTPSARRATLSQGTMNAEVFISTHALREEGDNSSLLQGGPGLLFLPTPSARRATQRRHAPRLHPIGISTHALREEGDRSARW